MGRTITAEEAKSRTGYDLVQEAAQNQQPLIVMLENGSRVSIQQYQPPAGAEAELLTLEPLPQFSVGIPKEWKDALYDPA